MCPAYYTDGPSRCPGCGGEDFFEKHPSCSFITCCVKKRGLEVCSHCEEYPCGKFMEQQGARMGMLRIMLDHYNDGRSKTFYCLAATLLSLDSLSECIADADRRVKEDTVSEDDLKKRAKILKSYLNRIADDEGEVLKLRKNKHN